MNAELQKQIDAAFDYRGHVTLTLTDGSSVEGYIYNRQFGASEPFVELFVKNSEERRTLPIAKIASVAMTGEDCAAGKSFEDYQKSKK